LNLILDSKEQRIKRCKPGEDSYRDASDQVMDCFGFFLGQG